LAFGLSVSILIPVHREPPSAADKLRNVSLEGGEILVADAGESPETAAAYAAAGARVLSSPGTRGARLHRAAAGASGRILFFLHADSTPPENALALIRRAVAGGAAAGAFSLAYEGGGPAMAAVAAWANARSRLLRLPFGDQGIFCRREAYERAGGYPDLSLCDDLDFVRRLRRAGSFRVLPERTVTSPRRYLENGVLRQAWRSLAVQLGYLAGVSPPILERWYGNERRSNPSPQPARHADG
jgi:rSAM/selenodomain-associated transferase 2